MSAETDDNGGPTHWVESLVKIQGLIQEQDDESLQQAIETCKNVLNMNDIPVEVQSTLYQIWIQCEMQLDHFDQISSIVKKAPDSIQKDSLQPFSVYALYRMGKHAEAFTKASKQQSIAAQHITAQSLFRLYRTKEAMDLYQSVLEQISDEDEQKEVMTNSLSVVLANGTPYVGSHLKPSESLLKDAEQALADNVEEYPYDLAYNLAMWELLSGKSSSGHALLEKARQACIDTCQAEETTEEEIQKEVAPILATLGWSRLLQGSSLGHVPKGTSISPAVQAVVDSNKALDKASNPSKALASMPDTPDSHWTALQRRIYYYNRAVLQYRANQVTECRSSLQELQTCLQPPKKKKQPTTTFAASPASPEDLAWWQARADVLEAHLLVAEKKQDEAVALLKKRSQELESFKGMVVDHAVTHVRLHLNSLEDSKESPMSLLQSLPESIRSQKAVLATMASLHHKVGQTDKATALLQQCGSDANQALADFYMSQHQYEKAAELYEDLASSGEKEMVARWVQALSYVDPQRASEEWNNLDNVKEDEENLLDANALEEMEPPRFKTARKASAPQKQRKQEKKKSHEAVLRRRAKKREEYLARKGLTENSKPDPERWLPKHERSRGGRRKKRGKPQKSHQGGVSEKDAAKLDARAKGTTTTAKSTAHYHVASDTKRGGGRRR